MFLRRLWDISLNGDLIEISQRYLMPAGERYKQEFGNLLENYKKKFKCSTLRTKKVRVKKHKCIYFTKFVPLFASS